MEGEGWGEGVGVWAEVWVFSFGVCLRPRFSGIFVLFFLRFFCFPRLHTQSSLVGVPGKL